MDVLEKLRIFKRLTETKSFSAVAQEMGVGQPTISKALATLEKTLGVPLFRRSTRGLSLTPEGQKLLLLGSPLLDQVDSVFSSVRNEKLLLKGQVKVTASVTFARLIITPLLEKFSELHPELKFHFHLSDGFVDLIENGIDLAIRIGELEDSGLKAIKLGNVTRSIYAAKSYIEKFGKPRNLEELKKHRLLLYTRNYDRPVWPLTDDKGDEFLFPIEPYLQSDGSDLLREAIVSGIAIGLVPTWAMIEPVREKRVVSLFEKNTRSTQPIYALSANGQELTAKQRAVAEFLKTQFAKIPSLSAK
jgi:LysR family transcriptional regulator for bpeEF and oprC